MPILLRGRPHFSLHVLLLPFVFYAYFLALRVVRELKERGRERKIERERERERGIMRMVVALCLCMYSCINLLISMTCTNFQAAAY
jgi:uncharacterized protein (DUF2062 family)